MKKKEFMNVKECKELQDSLKERKNWKLYNSIKTSIFLKLEVQ